jgi:hypothetical protein
MKMKITKRKKKRNKVKMKYQSKSMKEKEWLLIRMKNNWNNITFKVLRNLPNSCFTAIIARNNLHLRKIS